MGNRDIATIRRSLDSQLSNIQALVANLKFQEAAEHLSKAEELFEQLESSTDPNNKVHRTIIQNRIMRIDILCQDIENGLERREIGKKEDGNIAFKCNWNDKGYKGVCSHAAYEHNISQGRLWCSRQQGRCRYFVDADPVPEDCCYESRALLDCSFGAGWDHDQYGRLIRPRKIWSVREGKIAVLTVVPPAAQERIVVGAFLIQKVWDDPGAETYVYGDKNSVLDDMLQFEIRFWNYHKNLSNPNSTAWATGLFRYVSDVAVLGILEEYISKKTKMGGDTSRAEELTRALKDVKRI